MTTAIAEAHAEAVRSREVQVIGARQRFAELIIGGDPGSDEIRQHATATLPGAALGATLLRAAPRLSELLRPGIVAAVEHPHLAATVRAFADGGFSVSEAARRLSLHPNSVAYRLERWHQLTGWDPRSFDGLVRSLGATLLSEHQ